MKARPAVASLLTLVSLAALCGVVSQQQQLNSLRSEQQKLIDREGSSESRLAGVGVDTNVPGEPQSQSEAGRVAPELLRLRSEFAQLTQQRRELDGIEQENRRLRDQLATSQTNGSAGKFLPPGFIRRTQAQFLGYSSPENTLQTFFWALQNHSVSNLLAAFAPPMAQQLTDSLARSGTNDFFRDAHAVVMGFGTLERKELPDGSIELTVQMAGSDPQPMRFQQVNGQWKIGSPF